jgi:hypothetical protein
MSDNTNTPVEETQVETTEVEQTVEEEFGDTVEITFTMDRAQAQLLQKWLNRKNNGNVLWHGAGLPFHTVEFK